MKEMKERSGMLDIREYKVCVNTILNTFYAHSLMTHIANTKPTHRHPRAVEKYQQDLASFGEETFPRYADLIFSYLVVALAGEARHLNPFIQILKPLRLLRSKIRLFQGRVLISGARDRAHNRAINSLLAGNVEAFLYGTVETFNKLNWGEGYGGTNWGKIAETTLEYARGEIEVFVFLDRVFALRHNGGKLFDKHLSFHLRTGEAVLGEQLTVQHEARDITELIERLTKLHSEFEPACVRFLQRGETMHYWTGLARLCAAKPAIDSGTTLD